jgi:hypothetical protein
MSGVLKSGVFTTELINDTLTIIESMGVKRLSVFNASTVSATVLGFQSLGSVAPSVINLAEDETYTVDAVEASVLGEVVVTSPVGCTLKITAIV